MEKYIIGTVLAIGLFTALGGRIWLISCDAYGNETRKELISYITEKYQESKLLFVTWNGVMQTSFQVTVSL